MTSIKTKRFNIIEITNILTGEVKQYKGKLMVALNGMIFVKANGHTI